jgi:hypothetical protein
MTRAALLLGALFLGSIASAAPTKVVQTTRTEQVDRGKATYETGKFDGRAYNKRTITMHGTQTTRGVIDGKPFARSEKVEPYANEIGGGGTRVTIEGHMDGVAFKKVTTRAAMPGSMGGGYGFKVEGAEPAMP